LDYGWICVVVLVELEMLETKYKPDLVSIVVTAALCYGGASSVLLNNPPTPLNWEQM
jgi:hypothetical protein